MSGRHHGIISADGHLESPPETWVRSVPELWRERAPRLVHLPEGGEGWVVEGQPTLHNGADISGRGPIRFRPPHFSFAETNASWLPGALHFVGDNYALYRDIFGAGLAMAPSEYLLRHCRFGIVRDPSRCASVRRSRSPTSCGAATSRTRSGPSPAPSPTSTRRWGHLDPAVRRRILVDNPAEFFGLELAAELTPTPAP